MRRAVKIVEVGARDGLQNAPKILSPATKAQYVNLLLKSDLTDVEVGSFVSGRVKQMATTGEVLGLINNPNGANLIALVGGKHHAEQAVGYPILDTLAVFTSISERFCQANNGCDTITNMTKIKEIIQVARKSGKKMRGYVSCVFGCPFEGYSDHFPKQTAKVVQHLLDLGCYEVSIADTIGSANPSTIILTVDELVKAGIDLRKVAIHLHDPKGEAQRNLIVALACGISTVDGGTGDIGGCPSSPNPSANIDTRKIVKILERFNIAHCVDDSQLQMAASFIGESLRKSEN